MRFWTREIAGWILLGFGMFGFYACFVWLMGGHIIEAGMMTFISFIIFRGGVHLLKVSLAARICSQMPEASTRDRPREGRPTSGDRGKKTAASEPATIETLTRNRI